MLFRLKPSMLTGQHDHPVLLIPAGVERDRVQGKESLGNDLPGVLMVIATLLDHHCPIAVYGHALGPQCRKL
jgi:hypothetical protein